MNKTASLKHRIPKGSEDLWLDEAYKLLARSGVESVKVMPLSKSLNVSRTSFYWYFKDREALLSALIDRWQKKNTQNLIDQSERYAESITEAVFNLFDCWIDPVIFDAKIDFAIRNWANQDDEVDKIMQNSDQQRIAAITSMFTRFGYSEKQADIRAHTVYYTQVGYISMKIVEPFTNRLDKMPRYVELFTGKQPTKSEISRFTARHRNHSSG